VNGSMRHKLSDQLAFVRHLRDLQVSTSDLDNFSAGTRHTVLSLEKDIRY